MNEKVEYMLTESIIKLRDTVIGSGMVTEQEFDQIVEKHKQKDREEKLKVFDGEENMVGESGEELENRILNDCGDLAISREFGVNFGSCTEVDENDGFFSTLESKVLKDCFVDYQQHLTDALDNNIRDTINVIKAEAGKAKEAEDLGDLRTLDSKVLEDCKDLVINKIEEIYDGHIEFDKLNGGQYFNYFEDQKIKYKEEGRVLKDLGINK